MDITIKTAFNPGDRIYIPMLFSGEWSVSKIPYEIIAIDVRVSKRNQIDISYTVIDDMDLVSTWSETSCFASYNRSLQWCEEQNTK
jgi:hypothetical protein